MKIKIFFPIPPPLFNYASFCKVLSIFQMDQMIHYVLVKSKVSRIYEYDKYIFKMFMKEISVLTCYSNIPSEFFYQLAQLCHNIQSLCITFEIQISNGLKDLTSSQN